MGLADVDDEEFGLLLESVVDFFEDANLASEGRSGIAAEDEDDRSLALETGEFYLPLAVHFFQVEVRRRIADLQLSLAPQIPRTALALGK